jgi:hypothetical protein
MSICYRWLCIFDGDGEIAQVRAEEREDLDFDFRSNQLQAFTAGNTVPCSTLLERVMSRSNAGLTLC